MIRRFFEKYKVPLFIIGGIIIFTGSMGPKLLNDTGLENLYAYQAQTFLQGRLDIQNASEQLDDIAIYNQHYYVVFPPFPALVLLPFVALTGIENTRPMLVAIALTLLNFYLFTSILKKVGAQKQTIPWLVAAFFLGTGYWLELCWSTTVWHFAEIVAITCLLLALNEAFGKARGVLVGFFLGMAVLSRQNTIFSLIFLCIILWRVSYPSAQNKNRLLNQFGMFAALGIWGIFYLYLNWSRFGNIFDTGYAYILTAPGFLQERLARYGLFNIVYIPFNFIYLFLQGFQVQFDPANSYLSITNTSLFGTSLTFASPFLLIAFFAKWEKKYLRAAWVSIGCTLVLMLLYYNNGWWQLNAQRFTLDFMPILILLVAFGMQHVDKRIVQAAIGYSVALNIIALFIVPLVVILTNLSLPF